MPRLFSYVVDHDFGTSPDPYGGLCTLAKCKFGSPGRRNVVELASVNDWIAGVGGTGRWSAGHGRLIYAMRVTAKPDLAAYCAAAEYAGRADADVHRLDWPGRFALVSRHYFYFGANAIRLPATLPGGTGEPLRWGGRGFRNRYAPDVVAAFTRWLEGGYSPGIHGDPCGGRPDFVRRCHLSRPSPRRGRPECPTC